MEMKMDEILADGILIVAASIWAIYYKVRK